MCHRLHDASIANDAMQRIYDPDANDVARIKRLRKNISREQKLLAFLLLRQSKKKTRPHNNEFKSEEEKIDSMGIDNEFESEEEEIGDMGMDNELESEEEQIDVGGVDAVFENREDNHLEESVELFVVSMYQYFYIVLVRMCICDFYLLVHSINFFTIPICKLCFIIKT